VPPTRVALRRRPGNRKCRPRDHQSLLPPDARRSALPPDSRFDHLAQQTRRPARTAVPAHPHRHSRRGDVFTVRRCASKPLYPVVMSVVPRSARRDSPLLARELAVDLFRSPVNCQHRRVVFELSRMVRKSCSRSVRSRLNNCSSSIRATAAAAREPRGEVADCSHRPGQQYECITERTWHCAPDPAAFGPTIAGTTTQSASASIGHELCDPRFALLNSCARFRPCAARYCCQLESLIPIAESAAYWKAPIRRPNSRTERIEVVAGRSKYAPSESSPPPGGPVKAILSCSHTT